MNNMLKINAEFLERRGSTICHGFTHLPIEEFPNDRVVYRLHNGTVSSMFTIADDMLKYRLPSQLSCKLICPHIIEALCINLQDNTIPCAHKQIVTNRYQISYRIVIKYRIESIQYMITIRYVVCIIWR